MYRQTYVKIDNNTLTSNVKEIIKYYPNYNSFYNFNYLDLPDCYDPV